MDKKIQDAAGNNLPSYQEKDWDKMELLLDKHLPQEKKKKPFPGFILLLLAGIPVLFMLTTYKRPPSLTAEKKQDGRSETYTQKTLADKPTLNGTESSGRYNESSDQQAPPAIGELPGKSSTESTGTNHLPNHNTPRKHSSGNRVISRGNEPTTAEPATRIPPTTAAETPAATTVMQQPTNLPDTTNAGSAINQLAIKDSAIKKDSLTQPVEPEKSTAKKTSSVADKLTINFSAGPDISSIGFARSGQWKMQYGIGIGYALTDRWQIRTGLLISRKLYSADSNDYHPPANFWAYYSNIQRIDANCLVYEIPLNVAYTFPSRKKYQWFVSAGVSSYLMKKEDYEYYYKNSAGEPVSRSRSIENENDHFFSILQLSGGYQYRFSDKLSLMAEPYFKLPLGGVGFGKVKLNNTGVLFTLGYKPFLKNK